MQEEEGNKREQEDTRMKVRRKKNAGKIKNRKKSRQEGGNMVKIRTNIKNNEKKTERKYASISKYVKANNVLQKVGGASHRIYPAAFLHLCPYTRRKNN